VRAGLASFPKTVSYPGMKTVRVGRFFTLAIAISSLPLARLSAQTITNPSFELVGIAPNSVDRSGPTITGWTPSTNAPDLANSTLAQNLSQYVFLYGPGGSFTDQESVSQTIADTPGQNYTVSFYLRGGSQNDWSAGDFFGGFSATWLPSSAGGGFSWTGSSAGLTFQAQVNGVGILNVVNPGTGAWFLQQFSFTGTGADTLTFQDLGDAGTGVAAFTVFSLDNVSIQSVPEPSTATLLALGAGVLLLRAFSRSRVRT
jgi:hypothetical protein